VNDIVIGSGHEKVVMPRWLLINGVEVVYNEFSVDPVETEQRFMTLTLKIPVKHLLTVPADQKEMYLKVREALRVDE
jgi:hypothetical protein